MSRKKHPFAVRWRAFSIWRHLGFLPWKKPVESARKAGDFYKGAFDNIPFLNDDAKRTFQHLLLRPGHMIRDYIGGQHERYLAPLTSLIVFYAFFALIAAVLQPVQHKHKPMADIELSPEDTLSISLGPVKIHTSDTASTLAYSQSVMRILHRGYVLLHLDEYPEEIHTQRESSLAAFEGVLRSQGIPLFITEFLFLWIAMYLALRRRKIHISACAAASAYVLCQFSFFMLFAVLLTWGKSTSISLSLMFVLLVIDYRQWLGLSWKKAISQTLSTGIYYGILYGLMILVISAVVFLLAFFKTA